ncbi:hypothetical protein EVAR_32237_1 [Eumeta japonica]|uniref:Uncharacterized protein n=1 Tax=Eumeta variegata TaxID=151549 RepID=A0A4C1YIH9_EUMVA|nr:hypothetical protein EVAR_32237_1 [Eumeta japonica]
MKHPGRTLNFDPIFTFIFNPSPVLNFGPGPAFDHDSDPFLDFDHCSAFNFNSATSPNSGVDEARIQQLASRWHWLYRRYCACVIPLFAPQSGDSCLLRVSALGHLLKKNTA